MAERSRFWDGTTVGDASEAPYDAPTEFARVLRTLAGWAEVSANKGGVLAGASGYGDGAISYPGGGVARIASLLAFVQGTWYESDANVDIAIPTPATLTRVDRITLRKVWASQTVRLYRIAGTEGAGAPALVQSFGTTWDFPLYQVQILTNGTLSTSSDDRGYLQKHDHSSSAQGGALGAGALSLGTASVSVAGTYDVPAGTSYVFVTVSGVTVRLPAAAGYTNLPPITVSPGLGLTVAVTSQGGTVYGGSVNQGTGVMTNGSITSTASVFDAVSYKSDGTNWRPV